MLTKEKIGAVKKQLCNGVPEGEIKNELRNQGYTEEEISTIFKPSQINLRSYLISALLLLALGIYQFARHRNGQIFFFSALIVFVILFVETRKRRN